ncbi:Vegetative incompatibility protein HET-E-1 [Gracilariopsis chorda]|uniref:Vegetative incompatibility protein HET-E-1 n=1 Tax=Gracilariopsis chorda TaxID=448386 RepID=A0A2V3IKZ0_9FLOR|nr:Vegetative incompatibility protein HET-E-1 [Gracilariopsis chorda]|eukprot:PXF42755.1 Vegetative incompatibility protein HET-E-1 [Gracilariopsis chorda]
MLDLSDLDDVSSLGHHADNSDGQRSLSTMSTSRTECTCGAFSDNQKRVVIGYSDGRIVVRNADSGYKFESCFESPDRVTYIAISGDGRRVVSASRRDRDYVRVWDASSENAVGNQLVWHPEETGKRSLAVSFNGNVIVSVKGRIWHRSSEAGIDSDYSIASSSSEVGTDCDYSNESNSSDEGRKEDSLGERCSNDGKEDELLHENGSPNEENEDELIEENSHSDVGVEDELVDESDRSDEGTEDESGGETPSERSVERLRRFSIQTWDRERGEMMTAPPEVRDDDVLCATVSRDGRRVVSGSRDGVIRLWKLSSAETPALTIQGHTMAVTGVALSADGNCLVSSSLDGTVFVWNTETGGKIEPFEGYAQHIDCVGLSADGHEVVTKVSRGSVRVRSVENADTGDGPDRYTGEVRCVA